jgi:hypothetical protein
MTIRDLFPDTKPSLLLDFARVKSLDPRVTFTRASGAVYYDGVTVAKAEENLLGYSQEFGEWGKGGIASVTVNAETAPDGTLTADTVIADGTNTTHFVWQSIGATVVASNTFVFSVFAKAGTNNFIQFYPHNSNIYANFDLSTGAVGDSANCTASIVSVGNGWYRCIVTYTSTASTTQMRINIVTAANSVRPETNTLSTSVILWGAQLEQRSAATAYTPTVTQLVTKTQPQLLTAANNQARFDHNPVTNESLGLFIEEQRTNIATRSEEFNVSPWSVVRSSVIANVMIAPDGTLTADKHVEDTTLGSHDLSQNYTATSGNTYTFSVYAKAAERTQCSVRLNRTSGGNLFSGNPQVVVNLIDGSVVSTSNVLAYIINHVGNGWYRISVTQTATGTGTQNITVGPCLDGVGSYTGDGYSGIYVWGAQLEVNVFPTSYIKTEASEATRIADSARMIDANFTSWFRQDQGTIYVEASCNATDRNPVNAGVPIATFQQAGLRGFGLQAAADTKNLFFTSRNDVEQLSVTIGTYTPETFFKIIGAYSSSNSSQIGCVNNGTLVSSGYSDTTPIELLIGRTVLSGTSVALQRLNGTIKKLSYYPYRVPNIELQALSKL